MKRKLFLSFLGFVGFFSVCFAQNIEVPRKIAIALLDSQTREVIFSGFKDAHLADPILVRAREIEDLQTFRDGNPVYIVELTFKDRFSNQRMMIVQVHIESNHNFLKVLKASGYHALTSLDVPNSHFAHVVPIRVDSEIVTLLLDPSFEEAFKKAQELYPHKGNLMFYRVKRTLSPESIQYEMMVGLEAQGKSFTFPPEVIQIQADMERVGERLSVCDVQADIVDVTTSKKLSLVTVSQQLKDSILLTPEGILNDTLPIDQAAREIAKKFFSTENRWTDVEVSSWLERHSKLQGYEVTIDPNSPEFQRFFREFSTGEVLLVQLTKHIRDILTKSIKQ